MRSAGWKSRAAAPARNGAMAGASGVPAALPGVGRLGVGMIVTIALIRVMSVPSRTPWWEVDPLLGYRPETTLTPAMGLTLDALVWGAAAAIVVGGVSASGRAMRLWTGLLVLTGVIGAALHGLALRPLIGVGGSGPRGDLEALSMGSAWAAAMVGAWALWLAAGDRHVRRGAALALLSVIVPLTIRGGYQALVEHSRMVRVFEADPGAMLASQGWEVGSVAARLFERRLRQIEATGWFGLSNVYGSLAAGCLVAWGALSAGAWGAARKGKIGSGEAGAVSLVALGALGALALSGSKGAVGAAVIGGGCLGAAAMLRGDRWRVILSRSTPWLGASIMGAVLSLVALRGGFGEGLGERSLLFRAQYLAASARIIAEHPLVGVGPMGFKDAYLLAKSPTSPEEIESPHSLFFDWTARLGVFGAGWVALWLIWMRGAGMGLRAGAPTGVESEDESNPRRTWLGPAVGIGVAALVSIWIERAALGADLVAILALAVLAGVLGVAMAMRGLHAGRGEWIDRGLGAAAMALAAHAMIEVTPVTPGAGAWHFALVALAAGGVWRGAGGASNRGARSAGGGVGGVACVALLCVAGGIGFRAARVWKWEGSLRAAAAAVAPVGEMQDAAREAMTSGPSDHGVSLRAARALSVPRAITELDRAAAIEPTGWGARLATARLELTLAYDLASEGRIGEAISRSDGALRRLAAYAEARPGAASAWGRLGSMREARAALFGMIPSLAGRVEEERRAASEAWLRAAERDPHGLAPVLAMWRLASALNDDEAVGRWARRALEIDGLLYLDPLKGLTDSEREDLQRTPIQEPTSNGKRRSP